MAFEQRDYAGGAADTTLAAGISATDLTITLASATGWPSGGANGPFFIMVGTIDPTSKKFVSNQEKIEVASRTGTSLTVANTGKRGIDGTSALIHSLGETVRHGPIAQDLDEANAHIANTSLDHHSQYLNNARHDTTARHTIGSVVPAGTPNTILPDAVAAAGAANSVARSDHTHGIAAATASSITGTNAEGASTSFARADHNHGIANDTITAAMIAPDQVGSSELAPAAIDDENLFGSALSPIIVAGANPGAVGAHRFWFNTASGKTALLKRNTGDTAWEVVNGIDWIPYTPALFNISLGNGFITARYYRTGKTVIGNIFHRIGSTTVFGSNIGFGIPWPAADLDSFVGYPGAPLNEFFSHGAARGTIAASGVYAAVGVVPQAGPVKALDRVNFFATAGSAAWGGGIPGGWTTADRLSVFFEYEAATAEDTNYV